ncbi:MAG: hypothetical protein AB1458_08435 [Bacteroidota bacterium]
METMENDVLEAMLGMLIVFGIPAVLGIFYCLTLQRTLEAVSPENRKMPPGQVWLLYIPLFNIVWHFLVVIAIADSLRDEMKKRGIPSKEERPTFGIGIATSVSPIFIVTLFYGVICWIIYWVKVAEHRRILELSGSHITQGDILDAPGPF